MATIRIEGLTKAFRDGEQIHTVLDGLDLEIADGQFLALLGRSGSGKSTLLNCLAGIETPDAGSIHVDDVELTALGDRERTHLRRDRIGIVFQFFNLLPMLPVLENVALPALLRGRARGEVFERAHELLQELELGDRASEMPDHLSGGEQQRVATARALINDPALLLADEPTGNLDADTAARTLELLRQVNERHGVTVLMVTHADEAARTARRVAHLVGGRIEWPPEPVVEETTTEEAPTDEAPAPAAEEAPKRKRKKGPPKGALFKKADEPEPEAEAQPSGETEQDAAEPSTGGDRPAEQEPTDEKPAEEPTEKPADEPRSKPKVRPSAKAAALFQKSDPDADSGGGDDDGS
jgi:putative ABC transport system ATP-binding protein